MDSKNNVFVNNPYEVLLKESARLGVGIKRLDFTLLSFATSYTLEDKENAEFKKLSEKELVLFDDEKVFLNEKLKIQQSYKIQITEMTPTKSDISSRIKLLRNKDLTKLIAQIDFDQLVFYEHIAMDILQDIYKKMIKEEFFIGVRAFDFKKDLLNVLNHFKNKNLKQKVVRILVAKGVNSVSPESEKLVLCYKDKVQDSDTIRKVSIIGVTEGDLILRHIEPGTARKGRNLRLEFIEPHIPPENKVEFSCSDNFEAKEMCATTESTHCIEYYAKKKGFITFKENKYDIENELDLSSVTFKEFGAVLGGLDNNITINVKSSSDLEDAVGSGVYIECETLVVNGAVGGNTTLKAKSVKVYGQTSPTAKIYANEAYASTHRGYIKADMADIDSVENGHIDAKVVKIKKTLGANVKAERVWIDNLGTNNTIAFGHIAAIGGCSGSNNKFVAQLIFEEENNPYTKLKKLEQRQRQLPSLIERTEQAIQSSKAGINKLMKKIKQLENQKMPVPANFAKMIRQYNGYNHQLTRLNKEESELQIEKEKIVKYLQERNEELFDAKVINKGEVWTDMNTVKFNFSGADFTYSTRKDEKIKLFFIKRYPEDGVVKIHQENEYEEKDLEWLKQSKES